MTDAASPGLSYLFTRICLLIVAFHLGGYGDEIHEMTEMAVLCWGQWELNNQPVWVRVGFALVQ